MLPKTAGGCLKIQVETGAVSGATCRIAAMWQKFGDTAHVYVAVIRPRDDWNTDLLITEQVATAPCTDPIHMRFYVERFVRFAP